MKHYILGIDTGGTYTDGVLLDAASQAVCAKTKARTTNQDYAIGIRGCLEALRIPDYSAVELVEREAHIVRVLCAQLGCTAAEILDSAPLREGVLQLSGLTPTDLLHVRGTYAPWNREAPARVLRRLAAELGTTPVQALFFAYGQVIDALRDACGAAMEASGAEPGLLVGIGAPAETWMRALQVREGWPVLVPEHAEVANAVGAAVSQVSERAQAIIRPDQEHRGFLVHLPDRLLRAQAEETARSA